MTRFRFSLLSLAGATAAIAAVCALLVNASVLVSRLVWGGTLLCLTFALLCTLLVAPTRRGFWVGFTVVGWLYVLFAYGPLSDLANVTSFDALLNAAAEAMPQAKQLQTAAALPLPRTIVVDTGEVLLGGAANQAALAEVLLLTANSSQAANAGPSIPHTSLPRLVSQSTPTSLTRSFVFHMRSSHCFSASLEA